MQNQEGQAASTILFVAILVCLVGMAALLLARDRGKTEVVPTVAPAPTISATIAPTDTVSPTARPTVVATGELTIPELQYVLMNRFAPMFFCDPDYYPIGRGDEQQKAVQIFPSIKENIEEYAAITNHLNIADTTTISDEQKLAIYR